MIASKGINISSGMMSMGAANRVTFIRIWNDRLINRLILNYVLDDFNSYIPFFRNSQINFL
jgi:hypothetical protein